MHVSFDKDTKILSMNVWSIGNILFKAEEYPDLRTFYKKVETKDQEAAVFKAAGPAAAGE